MELLLDEEDFIQAIQELLDYAERMGIDLPPTSFNTVRIAIAALMTQNLDEKEFALICKVIYNIGYRDNHFKSSIIH